MKEVLSASIWHRSVVLRGVRDQGGRLTGLLHRCGGTGGQPADPTIANPIPAAWTSGPSALTASASRWAPKTPSRTISRVSTKWPPNFSRSSIRSGGIARIPEIAGGQSR